ncbi:MAG: hypothetical protein JNM84_20050 [Planctomycetes bacterium]|nr:hypothetical protein [Planctomycetota bacterium]
MARKGIHGGEKANAQIGVAPAKTRRGAKKKRPDPVHLRLARATEAARDLAVHAHQVQREVARIPSRGSEADSSALPPTTTSPQSQPELLQGPQLEPEWEFRCFPAPDHLLVFIRPLRKHIKSFSESFDSELLWLLAGLLYPHGFRIGRYRAPSAHELALIVGSTELDWLLGELDEICTTYVPKVARDAWEPATEEERERWHREVEEDSAHDWTRQQWSHYHFLVRELHEVLRDFDYRRLLTALACEHGAGRRQLGMGATSQNLTERPRPFQTFDPLDDQLIIDAVGNGHTTWRAVAEYTGRSYSSIQRVGASLIKQKRLLKTGSTINARLSLPSRSKS